MSAWIRGVVASVVCYASAVQALQVDVFSPQGEVTQVQTVTVRFNGDAVRAGLPDAAAPVTLQCTPGGLPAGQGRWNDVREWVYRFDQPLPPGTQCTASIVRGWRSARGGMPTGALRWSFQTGAPTVLETLPPTWEPIEEEQRFVVRLSAPVTLQSVRENVWCESDGVGERIPVKLIEGAERETLLKSTGAARAAQAAPLTVQTLACQRRLTPGERMELVWGAGVVGPQGVATRSEQRQPYQVRAPFTAEWQCERENAQAGCLPMRPVQVQFTGPVERKMADGWRLKVGGSTLAPQWEEALPEDALVEAVRFAAPGVENAELTVTAPKDFRDASGRLLENASQFPLKTRTGGWPPLAKFAAAPFGVIERYAESSDPQQPALLPVTLRKVEAELQARLLQPGAQGAAPDATRAQVQTLRPQTDAQVIEWYRRVQRYDSGFVERAQARKDGVRQLPAPLPDSNPDDVPVRPLSLLEGQAGTRALALPTSQGQEGRPFEVVGIPLSSGFHVVELRSPLLGQALLDPAHGPQRAMVVRTSVLVTNLGVHFKRGQENALAWVTTLDRGQPVPKAQVRVSDCQGELLTQGVTDAQGRVLLDGLPEDPPYCEGGSEGYFVSARATGADGQEDFAFVWSEWQRGIEPWRFQVPVSWNLTPEWVAHTVFDRKLVKAGETVSMKHLVRVQTGRGLDLPPKPPERAVITHVGSGQEFVQKLAWRRTPTGGLSAHSQWAVPAGAKLGEYRIRLAGAPDQPEFDSGTFRVEAFRLPVLQGRIAADTQAPLVAAQATAANVQVDYTAGGPAAQLPVRVSAMVRPWAPRFERYDDYSFQPPQEPGTRQDEDAVRWIEEEAAPSRPEGRVVADRLPLVLDRQGGGRIQIGSLPLSPMPQALQLEATYADPNGEIHTVRQTQTLWPAAVVAGVQAEHWVSSARKAQFRALALDTQGQPQAGVPLQVRAVAHVTTTVRKRLVGGFYRYDSHTTVKDLGTVCSGSSDSRGLLLCEAVLDEPGEVELVASARDAQGHVSQAATTVWVTRQGELWFGGENHDRMDVLPERRDYQPGETARLQVRMPFRQATALVAVEREGILHTEVVKLEGQNPTVELAIRPEWGPNVFVSVLALRGRLREVPWYSFFTWGFRAPREWWSAFRHEGREYVAPTALVDLSKPAFRLGVAELRVGTQGSRLQVNVRADREQYPVRGKAKVQIEARLPDGKPAAGAEVAVAVVDRALLELMPNASWELHTAMMQRRHWSVQTATAQMEIVGRRHYGRKAAPAGGGGGHSATRELLDTLLLWQPAVVLDAKGQATVDVPLNDALTTFEVVAVADARADLFGTGRTSLRVAQDLQLISGLPPVVRNGDRFVGQVTVRNTTQRPMQVEVVPTLQGVTATVGPQKVALEAGSAQTLQWEVALPAPGEGPSVEQLEWHWQARELQAPQGVTAAQDALRMRQQVVPAVPVAVIQAGLEQIEGMRELPAQRPAQALPQAGGMSVRLSSTLAGGLDGVQAWWQRYPYLCLEQQTSKAIGLQDRAAWQRLMGQLPSYQDEDGLLYYFPPRSGGAPGGSEVLTAHLLLASHEAAKAHADWALPQGVRTRMLDALTAFVEGRLQRQPWSPRRDLDERKLAALAALAQHGRIQPRLLESLSIEPARWGVHALMDWIVILHQLPQWAPQARYLEEAKQLLRSRLEPNGSRIDFATGTGAEDGWWLMRNADVAAARMLLLAVGEPAWAEDAPRLLQGLLARQRGGAWSTTVANLWGGLAVEAFARRWERAPVAGQTRIRWNDREETLQWNAAARTAPAPSTQPRAAGVPTPGQVPETAQAMAGAPWRAGAARLLTWPSGGSGTLTLQHEGSGAPWLSWQAWAAVPVTAPVSAGYTVHKTVTPIEQVQAGRVHRGDIWRVQLQIQARADMNWVAVTDPVPAGATLLGSGLGRDSEIATEGERHGGVGWLAFEERTHEGYRAYYEVLPKGTTTLEYTVRLNSQGTFQLPPTRVEALYAPEVMGLWPNAPVTVEAAP